MQDVAEEVAATHQLATSPATTRPTRPLSDPALRAEIIQRLTAGETATSVAAAYGVSRQNICGFYKRHVKPMLQVIAASRAGRDIPQPRNAGQVAKMQGEVAKAIQGAGSTMALLMARNEKAERIWGKAEAADDLRTLVGLDRNNLTGIELHGKLTGELQPERASAGDTYNTIVLAASAATAQAQVPEPVATQALTQCIDIEPALIEPVELIQVDEESTTYDSLE